MVTRAAKPLIEPGASVGAFTVEAELGSGGMGAVYRAADERMGGRPVALKILRPSLAQGASGAAFVARFRQEYLLASFVRHPALPLVYGSGQDEGLHWYCMELVTPSEPLSDLIQRANEKREPLGLSRIRHWALDAAGALGALHSRQIIHRDIKPANLLTYEVDGQPHVKVLDLGVAHNPNGDLTSPGIAVGTPDYMAPEQAARPSDGKAGPRPTAAIDFWALGCTLYKSITGEVPFRAGSWDSRLELILHHAPPPPSDLRSDVPPEWDAVVLRLLEKDPEARPSDADEVLRDLRALATASLVASMPVSPPKVAAPPEDPGPAAASGASVVANEAPDANRGEDHGGATLGLLSATAAAGYSTGTREPESKAAEPSAMDRFPGAGAPEASRGTLEFRGDAAAYRAVMASRSPASFTGRFRALPRSVRVASLAFVVLVLVVLWRAGARDDGEAGAQAQPVLDYAAAEPEQVSISPADILADQRRARRELGVLPPSAPRTSATPPGPTTNSRPSGSASRPRRRATAVQPIVIVDAPPAPEPPKPRRKEVSKVVVFGVFERPQEGEELPTSRGEAGHGQPLGLPTGSRLPATLRAPLSNLAPATPAVAVTVGDLRGPNGIAVPRGSQFHGTAQFTELPGGKAQVAMTFTRLVLPDGSERACTAIAIGASGIAGVPARLTRRDGRNAANLGEAALDVADVLLGSTPVGAPARRFTSDQRQDAQRLRGGEVTIALGRGARFTVQLAQPL